ncbi:STAS domain-containing protein [Streptacidiphilus cavernicola]|uniref:STAS domain-containing protein n=1 Tax=Streptacidiphilus cavernicola TaxID=3342716 RepID=A0ABV6VQ07_9ACTN
MVTLSGEIDMDDLPALRSLIQDCLRAGIRVIDADVSALTFCDVIGLNFLLAARDRTAGAELRLHDPGPAVIRLLDLTGTRAHPNGASIVPADVMPPSRLCRGWGGRHLG